MTCTETHIHLARLYQDAPNFNLPFFTPMQCNDASARTNSCIKASSQGMPFACWRCPYVPRPNITFTRLPSHNRFNSDLTLLAEDFLGRIVLLHLRCLCEHFVAQHRLPPVQMAQKNVTHLPRLLLTAPLLKSRYIVGNGYLLPTIFTI